MQNRPNKEKNYRQSLRVCNAETLNNAPVVNQMIATSVLRFSILKFSGRMLSKFPVMIEHGTYTLNHQYNLQSREREADCKLEEHESV
uniref:Phosphatidylinositol glycan anchor biosynthesis class U protein n=1 Tax=Rhizophora mucronata TaxID=61149 RepID=A0A2P2KZS4_RHIMU